MKRAAAPAARALSRQPSLLPRRSYGALRAVVASHAASGAVVPAGVVRSSSARAWLTTPLHSSTVRRSYAGAAGDSVIDIADEQDFQKRVMEASNTTPIIVDCYADWCGPCRTLTPVLKSVVEAQGGKVILAKVNVDDVPEVANQLMVSSIPAVFAFWKRESVNRFIGSLPKSQVEQFVKDVLNISATKQ